MKKDIEKKVGTLYVVATPIGNLEDITFRAVRILKEVDQIAAEDTRHTRILLDAYSIDTPLISLHQHNEREKSQSIVAKILDGADTAYVSDAGTPCISDPGHYLISLALDSNVPIVPVPGACALVTALSICGFPADQFLFCGFVPAKENKRRRFLESLCNIENTVVFYESPVRIRDLLSNMMDILGDRRIVVARELTKVFEEVKRGKISEILTELNIGKIRGEFTVILEKVFQEKPSWTDEQIREEMMGLWSNSSLSLRDVVSETVRQTGVPRKRIYEIALKNRPKEAGP